MNKMNCWKNATTTVKYKHQSRTREFELHFGVVIKYCSCNDLHKVHPKLTTFFFAVGIYGLRVFRKTDVFNGIPRAVGFHLMWFSLLMVIFGLTRRRLMDYGRLALFHRKDYRALERDNSSYFNWLKLTFTLPDEEFIRCGHWSSRSNIMLRT